MEKNVNQVKEESLIEARIKQEDKKAVGKFRVVMVLAFLGGMFIAFLLIWMLENGLGKGLDKILVSYVVSVSPYLLVVVSIIMAVVIYYLYASSKKEYKVITEEEDERLEKIERKLGWGVQLIEIALAVSMGLFGLAFYNAFHVQEPLEAIKFPILLVAYMLITITLCFESKWTVNQMKIMNPEKKGSAFDFKFDKIWLESCDEAEKLKTYEAAFKAHCISNKLCTALLVIFVVIGMFFPIGILPLIIVLILRIVNAVTYTYYTTKK